MVLSLSLFNYSDHKTFLQTITANDLGFSSSNSIAEEGFEHNFSQFATPLNPRLFQTGSLSLFSPGGLLAMNFSPIRNPSPFFLRQSIISLSKDDKEDKELTSEVIARAQQQNQRRTMELELEKAQFQGQRDDGIKEEKMSNDSDNEGVGGMGGGLFDTPLTSMWMDSNTKASLTMRNDEKVNKEQVFHNKPEDSLPSQSISYQYLTHNNPDFPQPLLHQPLFVRPKKFGRRLEDEYEDDQEDFEIKKPANPQAAAPLQSLNILKQHQKRVDEIEESETRVTGTLAKDLGPLFSKASEAVSGRFISTLNQS